MAKCLPMTLEDAKRKLFKKYGGSFEFPVQDVDRARWAVESLKKNGITYSAMANAMGENPSTYCKWRTRTSPCVRVGRVVIEWLNKGVHDISVNDGIKRKPPHGDVASSDKKTVDSHKTKAPLKQIRPRVQNGDGAGDRRKIEYVYIVAMGTGKNSQCFKVGHSINPDERLKVLQTGNPKTLHLLDKFPVSSKDAEKVAHDELEKKYRKTREWFYGKPNSEPYEDMKAIIEKAIAKYRL